MRSYDDTIDYKLLNDTMMYIVTYMKRWGNIGAHYKEKYGSIRISPYFFDGSLHSITHPGYVYSQYPDWLWKLDCKYIQPFFENKSITNWIRSYQYKVYRRAYQNALKLYPNAREYMCKLEIDDALYGI